MTAIEKEECMENLKYLGVFNAVALSLASSGKQSNEEFSLDKPCYGTFPAVVHCLFKHIDDNECSRRFKGCWPIVGKTDRVKFRQVALSWFQEIKKAEPPATIPDFSAPIFDNPVGDRFVKFLLGFSTFVLQLLCRKQQETEYANKNGCDSVADPPEDQFLDAFSHCAASKNLSDLTDLFETEAKSMEEFRSNARSQIESFDQQLLQEKEEEGQQRNTMCDGLKKLARLLKYSPEDVDNALKGPDCTHFSEAVTGKAKLELQQYQAAWQHLEPLFEQRRRFDQACVLAFDEQPALNGVDRAKLQTASGQFPDVFLPDGRLDVPTLVSSLRSSVNILLEAAREAGNPENLAKISENSRRNGAVLTLAVQQLKELTEFLNETVSEMETSIALLETSIEKVKKNRKMPSAPDWVRPVPVYKFKPMPNVDFELLLKQPKYDWNQICSVDVSVGSVNSTMTTFSIGNDRGSVESPQVSTPALPTDETAGSIPENQIYHGPSNVDNQLGSSDITSIENQRGAESESAFSAPSDVIIITPGENVLSKHPTPARKFRLSMSPYSSSSSSSLKLPNRANGGLLDLEDIDVPNSSFDVGSGDSPVFDLAASRRFSMKLTGPLLEILEDDESV